jgi:Ca2+-transporting ATPase
MQVVVPFAIGQVLHFVAGGRPSAWHKPVSVVNSWLILVIVGTAFSSTFIQADHLKSLNMADPKFYVPLMLLLPVHVVLLELIIDPTCSIVLERQPAEHDIMERQPRSPQEKILTSGTLIKSIVQGLFIFAASFGTYFVFLQQNPQNPALARTMGISIIVIANLILVQVNSSSYDFAVQSMFRLARDKVMWGVSIGTVAGLLLILYTPLSDVLKLAPLTAGQFLSAIGIAAGSV